MTLYAKNSVLTTRHNSLCYDEDRKNQKGCVLGTVVEHYPSVLAIDFAQWHAQGISCVLFDVDSTITPFLHTQVQPEIIKHLTLARRAGILHIALISNAKKPARIKSIATQIGANAFFTPARFAERKPRPSLPQKAMTEFGVTPEQVAMVGDKYGMDVRAAKRARVARVAWVDRLGDADHPLDRYLRRPFEKLIKRRLTRP